jgi:hypothetical protein
LIELDTAKAGAKEFKQFLHVIQSIWCWVETRKEALTLFSITREFIFCKPEVGIAYLDTFTLVDTFLVR